MEQKIYTTDEEIAAYLRAEGAKLAREFGLVPPWALKNTRLEPIPSFIDFWKEAQAYLGDWPVIYDADQFDLTITNGFVGVRPLIMVQSVKDRSFEALDIWIGKAGLAEALTMLVSEIDFFAKIELQVPVELDNTIRLDKVHSGSELERLISNCVDNFERQLSADTSIAYRKMVRDEKEDAIEYLRTLPMSMPLYICGRYVLRKFNEIAIEPLLHNFYLDRKVILFVPTSSLDDVNSTTLEIPVRALAFRSPVFNANYCIPFLTVAD